LQTLNRNVTLDPHLYRRSTPPSRRPLLSHCKSSCSARSGRRSGVCSLFIERRMQPGSQDRVATFSRQCNNLKHTTIKNPIPSSRAHYLWLDQVTTTKPNNKQTPPTRTTAPDSSSSSAGCCFSFPQSSSEVVVTLCVCQEPVTLRQNVGRE
jgi:hypothetical protein